MSRNREYLKRVAMNKSALTTQLDGSGPYRASLTVHQVREFLKVAILPRVMLPDVKMVSSDAATWEESKIAFGRRVLRSGTEARRLDYSDRYAPDTGMVTITTHLFRGEFPLSDEILEDNVEEEGFIETVIERMAEAVGRDIEEIMLMGDRTNDHVAGEGLPDQLKVLNGWVRLARAKITGSNYETTLTDRTDGQLIDATDLGTDYIELFRRMVAALPNEFKGDWEDFRFYCPMQVAEAYQSQLAARGTQIGDTMLTGGGMLKYRNIEVKPVPVMPVVTDPAGGDTAHVLLANRNHLYAGFRRQIRIERERFARDGATSYVVTVRCAPAIAIPEATVVARDVVVEV